MIKFRIPGNKKVNHFPINNQNPGLSLVPYRGAADPKIVHARELEDAKAKFPINSVIVMDGITSQKIWAYRVIGYGELWKDCPSQHMSGLPNVLYVEPVRNAGPGNHQFYMNHRGVRGVWNDERLQLEADNLWQEGDLAWLDTHKVAVEQAKETLEEQAESGGYLSKQTILDRQVARLKVGKGDRIQLKGTAIVGTVVNILKDAKECEWKHNNTQPQFIEIRTDTRDQHNVITGSTTRYYPLKQVKV